MRRVVAGFVLTLALLTAWGLDANAQDTVIRIVEVGWWTQTPTADAPDGGIVVSGRLDGPQSVAAVRVDVLGGVTSLILAADESGGTATGLARIQACAVTSNWSETNGGQLDEAPMMNCDRAVPLVRDSESSRWSVDVTTLAGGRTGSVDIGLIPIAFDPAVPQSLVTFEVKLERPVVESSAPKPTMSAPPSSAVTRPTTPSAAGSPPVVMAPPSLSPATPILPPIAPATTTTTVIAADGYFAAPPLGSDRDAAASTTWTEAAVLVLIAGAVGVAVGTVSKLRELRAT